MMGDFFTFPALNECNICIVVLSVLTFSLKDDNCHFDELRKKYTFGYFFVTLYVYCIEFG